MRAQTSARRSDPNRPSIGGRRRGTSRGSHSAPRAPRGIRGRQDRVRGDIRTRLLGELKASGDPRPLARGRPPSPSLPGPTPFSSDRVSHQRHKRLLANSTRATLDASPQRSDRYGHGPAWPIWTRPWVGGSSPRPSRGMVRRSDRGSARRERAAERSRDRHSFPPGHTPARTAPPPTGWAHGVRP